MRQKVSLSGKSNSTLRNYSLHLAKMALHFQCLPTLLDSDQIDDYLYLLQQQHNTPSNSYFKHTVYGLRFAFRMEGLKDKHIELPSIKKDKKLPVILNRDEVKRLLIAPKLLKHRILIGLLYGCGLRCFEVRNIRIEDLDFQRKVLHVKQGKNKKDRYVPLSDILIRGLQKYILAENPHQWLFNGQPNGRAGGDFDSRYSQKGVQWAVAQACKDAGIIKPVTVHTLRHTYATHLLEDGLDIMTIKDLLGHECIDSTLIYLHVAQSGRVKPFSPLDTLYPKS
ncbi:integrase [Sporocytophaga myxococcoides]|uniref:Integrase n=1 Tax=Sporocytophaga myxococcoides TaxID=153721 RepID=A0A098LMS8_9BACT|nr:tyrosine-type recombinase/integrase [Sporocytophaga myxococcoides]GAL87809.1 integrase [Sporocytophaga myxococcoides]